MNRYTFLQQMIGLTLVGGLLAGCGAPTTPTVAPTEAVIVPSPTSTEVTIAPTDTPAPPPDTPVPPTPTDTPAPPPDTPVPPTPTLIPTPSEPAVTQVVIDGQPDDWGNYEVVGTDPADDQVPGSPDLAEVRAFSNDQYFYLLISQHEDGDTDHYDILMDVNGGNYDYQLSVWPERNQAVFAAFPVTGSMSPLAGVTAAQDEVIEVKMPLSAFGGQPVQQLHVQTFLGDRVGDQLADLRAIVVNEIESAVAAEAPTATSGPSINVTTSGAITQDEIWHGEIHLTGDIEMANGATLTIEPGTTVYIASNSDDRQIGSGVDDAYTRDHNDPVRLQDWSQNAILIDGRNGIIIAIGTADQPITFRPEGDSTSPAQWDGIYIERGTLQHAIVLYGGRTAVQILGNSGDVEIAYSEVRYFHWAGIDSHTSDVWIHHNIVKGGGHQGIGVRLNSVAEHNLVIGAQTGIAVERGSNAVVRNNIVLDSAVGISLRDGESAEVLNNTIARIDGPPAGWYYQGGLVYPVGAAGAGGIDNHIAGQVHILNNIVYGPFGWAIGLHTAPMAGSQVDYNLVWNTQDFYAGPGQATAGANNFSNDPMFVDAANGDFHLLPDSPAIDAGDPTILDPDGSLSDLGAYGGPEGDRW